MAGLPQTGRQIHTVAGVAVALSVVVFLCMAASLRNKVGPIYNRHTEIAYAPLVFYASYRIIACHFGTSIAAASISSHHDLMLSHKTAGLFIYRAVAALDGGRL